MRIALKPFNRIIMSLLIILGVAGVSHAEIDMATAVGLWLFDEGNGNTAGDASDAGNDGELIKSPAWVKGKFGMALEFNGKDNCVQTGQKLLDNLEEFTILTWVKTGKVTLNRVGLVGQNDSPEFGFIQPLVVNLWTPVGAISKPWAFKHDDGKWHHIAAVASAKFMQIYIDGEVQEGPGAGPFGTSNFNVNIGGCGIWDGDGNWFTGAMDEVAIFHSILDEDDVLTAMDGFTVFLAAEARGKLPITWGKVKARY